MIIGALLIVRSNFFPIVKEEDLSEQGKSLLNLSKMIISVDGLLMIIDGIIDSDRNLLEEASISRKVEKAKTSSIQSSKYTTQD